MSSIMYRSFADYMGFNWPKELACIIDGKRITWAELKAERVGRQAKRMRRIMEHRGPVHQAAFVWTFYVPGPFYGGWHLYIKTLRNSWWIHEKDALALEIMRMFPCGLLPLAENFYQWKKAFGRRYSRPGRFKKQGLVAGWVECDHDGGWPRRFTASARYDLERAA